MTGIIKEKDGSYSYRIKKVLTSGERIDTKKKGFRTQREARAARAERLAALMARAGAACGRIRCDALFADFMAHEASGNRKYATLLRYESLQKNHISPVFGSRYADTVTPGEITRFLRDKKLEGLSHGYIESIFKQLKVVFRYAVQNRYLEDNPADRACMPLRDLGEAHERDKAVKVFTEEEMRRLADRLRGTSALTPMLFGYYMGLRVSEAYAVRWRDVDLTRGTMRIDKQLQYQDHSWCLVPPKTYRGYREIAMPRALIRHLERTKAEQDARRTQYGNAYKKTRIRLRLKNRQDEAVQIDDFICVKRSGELLTPSSAKQITKVARELGLMHYRFHYLRHTHASMLANRNVSALLLKERLGHEKVDTAWSFYSHATQQARSELRAVLDQMPSSTL